MKTRFCEKYCPNGVYDLRECSPEMQALCLDVGDIKPGDRWVLGLPSLKVTGVIASEGSLVAANRSELTVEPIETQPSI